jgi:hypothetical protein
LPILAAIKIGDRSRRVFDAFQYVSGGNPSGSVVLGFVPTVSAFIRKGCRTRRTALDRLRCELIGTEYLGLEKRYRTRVGKSATIA